MDAALIDQTSDPFLGRWHRLVSTTNWEKGQIIQSWRQSLRESGAPGSEFSDESWSRRVGNITPQHVGRLRRVYERFIEVRDEYPGLYWSHFQAAVEWDDAEMWLEGAVQSNWSVADMRYQRWEATGGQAGAELAPDPSIEVDWDGDGQDESGVGGVVSGTLEVVQARERTGIDEGEENFDHTQFDDAGETFAQAEPDNYEPESIQPFADLPPLPPDVSEAFETFKLCILRHKLAGWQEISSRDLIRVLESLKGLALAPVGA